MFWQSSLGWGVWIPRHEYQWNTFTWLSVWLLSCAGICVMLPNANDWLRHIWLCVCARARSSNHRGLKTRVLPCFLDLKFSWLKLWEWQSIKKKKKLLSAVRLVGGGTSSFSLADDLLWTRDTLFLLQWVPSTPGRVEVRGRSWARLLLSQH